MILENRSEGVFAVDSNGNDVPVPFGPTDIAEQLDIPIYADDANAPAATLYFNTSSGAITYKDSDGNVHSGGGSGADPSATYVTTNDESELSNATQHANLSGDDLHGPAEHGDSEHDGTVPSQSAVDAKADSNHGNEEHSETFAVDGDAQPPESHDNDAHSATFITDGDGVERQIWVIANGVSDPSGAAAEDIIFEEEA